MNKPTDADRAKVLAEIRERLRDLSEFFEFADLEDEVPQDYAFINSVAGRLCAISNEIRTGLKSGNMP